jgi:hypothetical protein
MYAIDQAKRADPDHEYPTSTAWSLHMPTTTTAVPR